FDLTAQRTHLTVRRLALDGAPPDGVPALAVHEGPLAQVFDALDDVPASGGVIVFDAPVTGVEAAAAEAAEDETPAAQVTVRGLPVPPVADRPPRLLADGSEEPHPLTLALRRVVRAARAARRAEKLYRVPSEELLAGLRRALHGVMESAYAEAVGLSATGLASSKHALLRRQVLGRRLSPSGRAV